MRIGLLTSKFPPIIGGGETLAHYLAHGLGEKGHEITVITSDLDLKWGKYAKEKYYKMVTVEGLEEFCNGSGSFSQVCSNLFTVLKSADLEILHVFNFLPMFLVSQFRNLLSAKVIFTFHNTPFPPQRIMGYFSNFQLDEIFAKNIICGKSYDLIIAGSKFYQDWALKLGTGQKQVILIYFGIDTNLFSPNLVPKRNIFRRQLNLPDEKFVITLPSRVIRRKGILEALNSLRFLIDKQYPVSLFIPALKYPFDPEFASEVWREIRQLRLEENILVPQKHLSYIDMPKVYAASDLVIAPSYYEGLGLAVIEAMAVGVPVISTKVSGVTEVIKHNHNGILVRPNDHLELASAIVKVVESPQLSRKIVQEGIITVQKKFSHSTFLSKLESSYLSLI